MMKKTINVEEIKKQCTSVRKEILNLCYNASPSNTHLGGCMSMVELLTVLYLEVANVREIYRSDVPWEMRDRIIISKGHAGIALYAALKQAGILSEEDFNLGIRGEGSVLFRHPKKNTAKAIECSSGSLGLGFGYAIGLCQAFKLSGKKNQVYVFLGDGECNEGNVWESAIYASHQRLNNLTIIIDKNNLQLDGPTKEVMSMDNLAERWKSFGYFTYEIDGHDVEAVYEALIRKENGPKVIIANTIKGKGISFAENRVEWHDNHVNKELFEQGLNELQTECLEASAPGVKNTTNKEDVSQECGYKIKLDINSIDYTQVKSPKDLVGIVSKRIAQVNDKYLLLYSDCGKRINIEAFEKLYPKAACEMGIAEQNQICVAAGLADSGYNVFATAYAPFITARVLDQVRAFLGYMQSPVKLIGLSSGLALGDLGATHTALEDVANMRCIPNIVVISPADSLEMIKAMEALVNYNGSAYLRLTEPFSDDRVYKEDYEFVIGKSVVLKEGTDVAFIACGTVLTEVLNATVVLEKKGISCEVINMHTIKPLDVEALQKVRNRRLIVTVEEHSVIGGLGSAVGEYLASLETHAPLIRIGVEDRYFCADFPKNLREKAGLLSDNIVQKIEAYFKGGNRNES